MGKEEMEFFEEECRREWDSSASLQEEFLNNFKSYVAYTRAVRNGAVRIFDPKVREERRRP